MSRRWPPQTRRPRSARRTAAACWCGCPTRCTPSWPARPSARACSLNALITGALAGAVGWRDSDEEEQAPVAGAPAPATASRPRWSRAAVAANVAMVILAAGVAIVLLALAVRA